jgi:hypothetical protein
MEMYTKICLSAVSAIRVPPSIPPRRRNECWAMKEGKIKNFHFDTEATTQQ